MWRITDAAGEVLLGHDGDSYVGSYATDFMAWAGLWKDVIEVTPVGPYLTYPFDNEAEQFIAATVFVRERRITEAVDAVPPAGMEEYATDPDVVY